jgi:SSS family solute:Na+ symporter
MGRRDARIPVDERPDRTALVMPAHNTTLAIVALVVCGTIGFALFATRRIKMDPQQYIVAGRSFGTLFLLVLAAGETFTSFTFLGIAGLAYAQGAPAFYVLAYSCGLVIAYFFAPAVWRIGTRHSLLTGPDFFETCYNSRWLAASIALLQFASIVPYVALQLSALEILLKIAGHGSFDAVAAACLAFLIVALFVFTAGLHGTAWASIIKDAFVLGGICFAGIAIPMRFFGSPARMFDRVLALHPHMLTLPAGSNFHGTVWFVSTVLISAVGLSLGPAAWPAFYSARSAEALRRNIILLPFYTAPLCLMIFAGFAALLVGPGLKGTAVDQSYLLIVQHYYPSWILGLIVSAGALSALIPASGLLLAGASVISKNVAGDLFGIATDDRSRTLLTRALVLIIALIALGVWVFAQRTLVELLLLYFNGITQLAPAAFAAFLSPRPTARAVGAGLAAGLGVAIPLTAANVTPWGINPGVLALFANAVVVAMAYNAGRAVEMGTEP